MSNIKFKCNDCGHTFSHCSCGVKCPKCNSINCLTKKTHKILKSKGLLVNNNGRRVYNL